MASLESVRRDALSLSEEEREILALELALGVEKEPGYDEAWAAEIERRLKDIDSGTAVFVDDEDADDYMFGDAAGE